MHLTGFSVLGWEVSLVRTSVQETKQPDLVAPAELKVHPSAPLGVSSGHDREVPGVERGQDDRLGHQAHVLRHLGPVGAVLP